MPVVLSETWNLGKLWLAKTLYLGFIASFILHQDRNAGYYIWTLFGITFVTSGILMIITKTKADKKDKEFFSYVQFFLGFFFLMVFSIDRGHPIPVYFCFIMISVMGVISVYYSFFVTNEIIILLDIAFVILTYVSVVWLLVLFIINGGDNLIPFQ